MTALRVVPQSEFRAELAVTVLGRALEESAELGRDWRDLLDDEAYVVFVEVFGRWLDRERGRVRSAAGRGRAA